MQPWAAIVVVGHIHIETSSRTNIYIYIRLWICNFRRLHFSLPKDNTLLAPCVRTTRPYKGACVAICENLHTTEKCAYVYGLSTLGYLLASRID